MAIRIEIDGATKLRVVTFEGAISDADVINTFAAYWQSHDYDPSLNELYDLSPVTYEDVSTEGLRKIAGVNLDLNRDGPGVKVAMYAPTDVAFGLIRMYQVFVEGSSSEMRVFRDRDEALQWLGA